MKASWSRATEQREQFAAVSIAKTARIERTVGRAEVHQYVAKETGENPVKIR